MNAALPVVSGREVVRALEKAGFVVERVSGSHHVLVHASDPGRVVVVPVHAGRDMRSGTLRAIVRQSGLTIEMFRGFL